MRRATRFVVVLLMLGSVMVAPVTGPVAQVARAQGPVTTPSIEPPARGWLLQLLDDLLGRYLAAGRTPASHDTPTIEQLVGQKLVVRMAGPQAQRRAAAAGSGAARSAASSCWRRTSRARPPSPRSPAQLQRAAAAGGQPPLLIAIDQEGGSVKRVSRAPPTMTVPAMGDLGSTTVARAQGARTGCRPARAGHQRGPRPGRRRPPLDRRLHVSAGPHVLRRLASHGTPGRRLRDGTGVKRRDGHHEALPGHRAGHPEHRPLRRYHRGIPWQTWHRACGRIDGRSVTTSR